MKDKNASSSKLLLNFYNMPTEKLPKVELREKGPYKVIVLHGKEHKVKVFALKSGG